MHTTSAPGGAAAAASPTNTEACEPVATRSGSHAEQPGGVPARPLDQLGVLDHVRPPGLPPFEVTTHGRGRHVGGQPEGRRPEVPAARREPMPDVESHARQSLAASLEPASPG